MRNLIPGLSVENCAVAFLKHNNIYDEDLTVKKIVQTYFRIQKELHNEKKSTPNDGSGSR